MARRQYPHLTDALARQLASIPMTGGLYHPCRATLRDGSVVDCVYLAEAGPWFAAWGIWPEDDRGKDSIDIRDVVEIADSPSRLPAPFADRLYEAGESGMGYTVFTVLFRDGATMAVGTGNAVDFVDYPEGQSSETVVDVVSHAGRDDPRLQKAPDYFWCLFER